jgi:L-alanine-DL-glutamate epimerase-like enolase superfamily enzyme
VKIASIETRLYRYPLDPPFRAAWDPAPRRHQDATMVIVRSDEGLEGHASGDAVPDRELLQRLLVGLRPLDDDVNGIIQTVDFHHGRNWTVEIAMWDLVSRSRDEPLWKTLGGNRDRIAAYASTGESVSDDERIRRCVALRDAGLRALKLRVKDRDWQSSLELIEAVRNAVTEMDIMVDANQGWRMPGDTTPSWGLDTAIEFARKLEQVGIYWLEEPLPTELVEDYAALATACDIRIAAGEMVRTEAQARDLVLRGGVDVIQPDVVLSGGIGTAKRISRLADMEHRTWTPHTWSNGYGLLANLHAALAWSNCPYLEVPFDPPSWSAERRDWLIPATLEIAADGTIAPPPGPGLGVVPDFDALEPYRIG